MSAYVMDSQLFGDQFSTAEMREIFSDRMTVQKWLDVESALACAEAEAGVIPVEAADEIVRVADADLYDLAAMKDEMDRTSHPIIPLVRAMDEKCRGSYGGYVHWGATTQDIMDTGQILQIKEAWSVIRCDVEKLVDVLIVLAESHKKTIMAGRTHGQQAQPITFGYKVAVWLDELKRHQNRMNSASERLFVGQFSGAVGSMASLGASGLVIQGRMMELLELKQPTICWHVARDTMAEAAAVLAMLTGSIGKIAHEIFMLQKSEIAELEEPMPAGKVGSSTMPHKRNPAICETIVALARVAKGCLIQAYENLIAEHERDKIGLQAEREYVSRLHALTHSAVRKMILVCTALNVYPENMRRNLEITEGLMLSEAVMMALAPIMGRQEAHEVIYNIVQKAAIDGVGMKASLLASSDVTSKLNEREIENILDPTVYTGLCEHFVDRVLNA